MNYTKEQIIAALTEALNKLEAPPVLSLEEKNRLAKDPNTNPKVLEELADDKHWIRRYVAENPNCPIKLLEKLVEDEDWFVRSCVAENPNCPIKVLEKLADDKDWFVRESAMLNPNYKKTLTITPAQHKALKSLIDSSQDPALKSIMDS